MGIGSFGAFHWVIWVICTFLLFLRKMMGFVKKTKTDHRYSQISTDKVFVEKIRAICGFFNI